MSTAVPEPLREYFAGVAGCGCGSPKNLVLLSMPLQEDPVYAWCPGCGWVAEAAGDRQGPLRWYRPDAAGGEVAELREHVGDLTARMRSGRRWLAAAIGICGGGTLGASVGPWATIFGAGLGVLAALWADASTP